MIFFQSPQNLISLTAHPACVLVCITSCSAQTQTLVFLSAIFRAPQFRSRPPAKSEPPYYSSPYSSPSSSKTQPVPFNALFPFFLPTPSSSPPPPAKSVRNLFRTLAKWDEGRVEGERKRTNDNLYDFCFARCVSHFFSSPLLLLSPPLRREKTLPISSSVHFSLVFAAATFGFLPNHLILCKFSYWFSRLLSCCCFTHFFLGFARDRTIHLSLMFCFVANFVFVFCGSFFLIVFLSIFLLLPICGESFMFRLDTVLLLLRLFLRFLFLSFAHAHTGGYTFFRTISKRGE